MLQVSVNSYFYITLLYIMTDLAFYSTFLAKFVILHLVKMPESTILLAEPSDNAIFHSTLKYYFLISVTITTISLCP